MMFNFVLEYWNKLSNMYKIIATAIIVIAMYYAFNWYQETRTQVAHSVENYDGTENANGKPDLVCTMYYTTWCKFCTKAKPEWERVIQEFNGKVVNGKKILITKIDCEKNTDVAEKENIKGYPTFKFNLNDKYYDYPDEPVFDKFKTFINYLVGRRE